jgi:WxL domain surface cell wall-binding
MRRHVLFLLGVIAALALPSAATAATDTTSIALAGGTLTYTTPFTANDFPNTTLTGIQQTVTTDVNPYVVTDSRGGSAGWNLTIAASQFSDGSGHTLATGSLAMVLPPVPTTTVGNLGITPVVSASLSPIDGGTTQKIASALAVPLGGAGQWTFTPLTGALVLTVPPSVTPGTYTSTITTTLSTGP